MRDIGSTPGTTDLTCSSVRGWARPGWFVEVGEQLRDVERVSLCIDVGHVGIRQARQAFFGAHPGLDLATLTRRTHGRPTDRRRAGGRRNRLPTVLEVTRALGRIEKPLDFHLHDGHPLIPGSHHFSFPPRSPFHSRTRTEARCLDVWAEADSPRSSRPRPTPVRVERMSLTLEIHQAEGRLPLGDAAGLFHHLRDKTSAERMNHWLAATRSQRNAGRRGLPTTHLDERDAASGSGHQGLALQTRGALHAPMRVASQRGRRSARRRSQPIAL